MAAIWGAAISAVGKVASQPAGGGVPGVQDSWVTFDHSGWTVATGNGEATASRTQSAPSAGGGVEQLVPWVLAAVVGIAVAKAWAKKG